MNNYKNILVALDYSAHSEKVLERAVRLARDHDAQLILVHIVEYLPPMILGDEPFPGGVWEIDEQQLLETARATMEKFTDTVSGVPVRSQVVSGNARAELENIAGKEAVDLIVAGSHGRTGIARLLGSTASALVHHAPCDLLLVRIDEKA